MSMSEEFNIIGVVIMVLMVSVPSTCIGILYCYVIRDNNHSSRNIVEPTLSEEDEQREIQEQPCNLNMVNVNTISPV